MNLHEELAAKDSLITTQSARIAELEAQLAPASPQPVAKVLSDEQIDYIARQYFAEEWAQNHLKNAIHDAFRAASTPTTLTEKK